MVGLAAVGELEYNGVAFTGANHITASVNFIYDEAGRTVTHHEYTIDVKGWVQADAGVNSSLEEMRAKLSKPGGKLKFINKGFGSDLLVNYSTGGAQDVKWGPQPKFLKWESAGGYSAAEIEWQVVTRVAMCNALAVATNGKVLAVNYEAVYRIDQKGFTTRTITGYLEIAQTRPAIGSRVPPFTADAYRNLISPQPPRGFIRDQEWVVDKSKNRIDFTITDDQIRTKNPWPPGVSDIRAAQKSRWARGRGAGSGIMKLFHELDAEIELIPGVPQQFAFIIFGAMVAQRFEWARQNQKVPFLDSLDVTEDIYGYSSRFSCRWRTIAGLNELLGATGLWEPLGTDWRTWKTTVDSTIFHQRGGSKLQLFANNDAIVDLCGSAATIPWNAQQPPGQQPHQSQPYPIQNTTPPAQRSYIDYQMAIQPSRQRPVVRQSISQETDTDQTSSNLKSTLPFTFPPAGGTDDILSVGGRSMYSVSLVGSAIRAGYQIGRPILQTLGGVACVEEYVEFLQKCIGTYFGVPVFQAAWNIAYKLAKSPGTVHARAPIGDELSTAVGAEDPPAPPAPVTTDKPLGVRRHTLWVAPTYPNAP